MQRGIIRQRSPSDTGDLERAKRQSRSAATTTTTTTTSISRQTTTNNSKMGHQLNPAPTNGHNGSAAGPSTSSNGASSSRLDVAGISPLEFDTKLMYGDDHDWAMYQSASQFDAEEHPGQGDAEAVIDGLIVKPTIAKGPAAAKRMPVDRQEVVRLMLQGLRDIGYK